MRIPIAASLASLSLITAGAIGCDDAAGPGPGEGEGEGEGDTGAVEDMELLEEPLTFDFAPVLSAGMALATRADGRVAFVYVELGAGTIECNLFSGTVTEDTVDVKVADELADGSFRVRTVASPPPLAGQGVDIAVDPVSDALVVAFQGGEPANGVCGASDLILAVEAGDTFTLTTIAQNASDGSGPCRDGNDPLCAEGDFVGRFPALSIADGFFALAYTDNHFGFGETDIFESDVELVQGTSPTAITDILSINTETGSGYNSGTTITSDGRTILVHQMIGNNIQDEGVYAEVQQSDGTFLEKLLTENPEVSSRITVGHRDGQGIFVAFREDATDQLLLFHSVDDGVNYTFEAPERLSVTGFSPTLGFLSDGTLVLAYQHCRDVDDGSELCSASEDGVRVTWRSPGGSEFLKKTFLGDDEDTEAIQVDMSITPDDVITTLSFNASQSQATIHRIQKVTR